MASWMAALGDLVEEDPRDLASVGAAELLGEVPGDGLALAVGVGRQEDVVGLLGGLLELVEDLAPCRWMTS